MLIKNGIIIIQGFENGRKDEETQSISISISISIYIKKNSYLSLFLYYIEEIDWKVL